MLFLAIFCRKFCIVRVLENNGYLKTTATLEEQGLKFHSPVNFVEISPLLVGDPRSCTIIVYFMTTIADYGCPDYFFTEYFRVHEFSRLDKHILRSITENATNRPIFGESIPDLVRTARLLGRYPVAGDAAGAFLRDMQKAQTDDYSLDYSLSIESNRSIAQVVRF